MTEIGSKENEMRENSKTIPSLCRNTAKQEIKKKAKERRYVCELQRGIFLGLEGIRWG